MQQIILRALDLITILIPPALPVAVTIALVFAQRCLRNHDTYCINPSAINVCSVINLACSDKVNPSRFEHGPLLGAMASCHSLTRIGGVLSGDPVDLKMFHSTKWEFLEEISEDHYRFEMAVSAIVRPDIKVSVTIVTPDSTIEPDVSHTHYRCVYHVMCQVMRIETLTNFHTLSGAHYFLH
ncbi:hypothetical protein EG68_11466 [Paragonimus skrjabini miyazakii]|uniref:Uncharacterized protein n=1 Tax=Paragonimus skrjabini miyazakii TaxID=59628 RepID=A0A8S9YJ08_9TREM|nr:hypothetical protein EG68_11466 [Paragonimus skrjabini miyazakii]